MSDDAYTPAIPAHEADSILADGIRLVRERSDAVLNAVDQGIYVLDAQGRTIFANETAVRLLGYTLREMLGRPQHELIHHKYSDGSPFPVEECPIFASVHQGVYQRVGGDVFWKKDGRAIPVTYISTPVKDGRKVLGAVITFRDTSGEQLAQQQAAMLERERTAVEERDRALAETRAGRELLEQMFEHVPAPLSMTSGADHRIVLANGRARELAGRSEMVGHTIAELFPDLVGADVVRMFDRVFATGEPFVARALPVEWDRDGDGTLHRAMLDIAYLPVRDGEGNVIGVLTYSTEVSPVDNPGLMAEAHRDARE